MDKLIFCLWWWWWWGWGRAHESWNVWNNKCHSSLKLFLSTLLSFSLTSLTFSHFQPTSFSHSLSQRTLGRLSYSNFTFPFSLPTFPPHFLTHTISLLNISHPPQLHFLDSHPTLHFPHGGPLICRWFSSSMWEVLFSTRSHIPSKINSFENLLSICSRRFSNQYWIASNP